MVLGVKEVEDREMKAVLVSSKRQYILRLRPKVFCVRQSCKCYDVRRTTLRHRHTYPFAGGLFFVLAREMTTASGRSFECLPDEGMIRPDVTREVG